MTEDGRNAVVKWLRESGYPLEMRLTTACLQSGLTTNSSFPYRDPVESGKVREADILVTLAFHWSPSGAVWVMRNVIECKSPGKPWVALMPTLTQLDPATALTPDDLVSLGDDHDVILPWLEQAWVEALASNAVPMASNLVTAHTKDDQLNNAMSALRQTLSAAYGLHAATGAGPAGVTMLTVPALVTSGELLSAHLDASGEPLVEDLDHVWVRVRHPIGVSSVYVHVMTEVYFVDRFVPALRGIQREGLRRSVRV